MKQQKQYLLRALILTLLLFFLMWVFIPTQGFPSVVAFLLACTGARTVAFTIQELIYP